MAGFRQAINPDHKFAVASRIQGGGMAILQTYGTKEELGTGLRKWRRVTSGTDANLCPVELVGAGIINKRGTCKVLKEPLQEERLS